MEEAYNHLLGWISESQLVNVRNIKTYLSDEGIDNFALMAGTIHEDDFAPFLRSIGFDNIVFRKGYRPFSTNYDDVEWWQPYSNQAFYGASILDANHAKELTYQKIEDDYLIHLCIYDL